MHIAWKFIVLEFHPQSPGLSGPALISSQRATYYVSQPYKYNSFDKNAFIQKLVNQISLQCCHYCPNFDFTTSLSSPKKSYSTNLIASSPPKIHLFNSRCSIEKVQIPFVLQAGAKVLTWRGEKRHGQGATIISLWNQILNLPQWLIPPLSHFFIFSDVCKEKDHVGTTNTIL